MAAHPLSSLSTLLHVPLLLSQSTRTIDYNVEDRVCTVTHSHKDKWSKGSLLVSKDIRHKNTEKPATHRYCVIVHKQESIYNTSKNDIQINTKLLRLLLFTHSCKVTLHNAPLSLFVFLC